MTDAPAIDTAALRAAAEAAAKDWYVAHDTFQVYANPKAILALLDRLAAAEARVSPTWDEIGALCNERDALRAERDHALHKARELRIALTEARAERDALQARLEAAERERDEARATVDAAVLRDVEKDDRLAAAQERIKALEADKEDLRASLVAAETRYAAARALGKEGEGK